jgi:hypothetical protein
MRRPSAPAGRSACDPPLAIFVPSAAAGRRNPARSAKRVTSGSRASWGPSAAQGDARRRGPHAGDASLAAQGDAAAAASRRRRKPRGAGRRPAAWSEDGVRAAPADALLLRVAAAHEAAADLAHLRAGRWRHEACVEDAAVANRRAAVGRCWRRSVRRDAAAIRCRRARVRRRRGALPADAARRAGRQEALVARAAIGRGRARAAGLHADGAAHEGGAAVGVRGDARESAAVGTARAGLALA